MKKTTMGISTDNSEQIQPAHTFAVMLHLHNKLLVRKKYTQTSLDANVFNCIISTTELLNQMQFMSDELSN